MKTSYLLRNILFIFIVTAGSAFAIEEADTLPPTLTITTPALGVAQTSNNIVVSGTATDTVQAATTGNTVKPAEIKRVEYRFSGTKKWKKAIIIPGTSIASSTWVFTFNLSKGNHTVVWVRAVDGNGNESDVVSRQVRRTRTTR